MNKRVLVVEDDHAICELIAETLQHAGYTTECSMSDADAYRLLTTLPTVHALVVDINLGAGTTGFDIARFGRRVAPDLPVIYISGEASAASFKANGVPNSDFLAKPFVPEELVAMIAEHTAPAAPD